MAETPTPTQPQQTQPQPIQTSVPEPPTPARPAPAFLPPEQVHIRTRVMIAAPAARVFRAFTEPAELTKWFCRRASVELKPGGAFNFGAGAGEGAKWEVKAFEAGKSLELARPETLRIEFWEKEGGRTLVHLDIQGHADLTDTSDEKILWSIHLLYLKAYLENGIDLREQDPGKTWKDGYLNGLEPF